MKPEARFSNCVCAVCVKESLRAMPQSAESICSSIVGEIFVCLDIYKYLFFISLFMCFGVKNDLSFKC